MDSWSPVIAVRLITREMRTPFVTQPPDMIQPHGSSIDKGDKASQQAACTLTCSTLSSHQSPRRGANHQL